jgi:hypothetical protein
MPPAAMAARSMAMRAKLSAVCLSLFRGGIFDGTARRRLVISGALLSGAVLGTVLAGAVIVGTVYAGAILAGVAPTSQQQEQSTQDAAADATPGGQPTYSHVYCSGFVRDNKISDELHLISGEEANYKIVFTQGNYVYLNQGASKGIKVGDRFTVVRPKFDPNQVEWFWGQQKLERAMGILYSDLGQLRIVNVQPKVSVAEVTFSCTFMQRGDIVRPFEERPVPPYKEPGPFDVFAPVRGKSVGMIVETAEYQNSVGQWSTTYINLGAAQGVKIGDYVRIFRHEGKVLGMVPETKGYYYEVYGFGSTPEKYTWKDLPREVLGEGIVLNASRNASTVLITYMRLQSFTGDEVEVE